MSRRRLLKKAAAVGGAALAAPGAAVAGGLGQASRAGRARPQVSRLGVPRRGHRPHDAPGTDAAADRRTSGRRPDRGDQPLLLEHVRRPRPARHVRRPDGADAVDPGPRRRGRRRGGRSRGAARAGGRPRVRVGHAAVRQLLPVPARPRRHVPVPRTPGTRTISCPSPTCATARRCSPTRTSAASPS